MHIPYEAGDVDVNECGHQKLAIESVHDSAMPGNDVTEILQKYDKIARWNSLNLGDVTADENRPWF